MFLVLWEWAVLPTEISPNRGAFTSQIKAHRDTCSWYFAKPRRTRFSLFFVVKTGSKVAQFCGLATVLATLSLTDFKCAFKNSIIKLCCVQMYDSWEEIARAYRINTKVTEQGILSVCFMRDYVYSYGITSFVWYHYDTIRDYIRQKYSLMP